MQLVSGSNIGAIYRGLLTAGALAFHLALTLLFMLITLFVLYRDGEKIAAQIDRSLALADRIGLIGTPSFIAGDHAVFGYLSQADLADLLTQ